MPSRQQAQPQCWGYGKKRFCPALEEFTVQLYKQVTVTGQVTLL